MCDNDSVYSGDSDVSTVQQLADKIKYVKEKCPITYQGHPGYWVNPKRLAFFERKLDELMEAPESSNHSPSAMIALNDELQALRAGKAAAEQAVSAANHKVHEITRNLQEYQKSVQATQDSNNRIEADIRNESARLKAEILVAQREAAEAKIVAAAAKRGFDPTDALQTQEAYEEAASNVTRLNNSLQEANKAIKQLRNEKDVQSKKLKAMQEENRTVHEERSKLLAAKAAGSVSENSVKPVEVLTIDKNRVKSIIGDKGLEWLTKANSTPPDNIKERVYSLMLAAKSGRSSVMQMIYKLLEKALNVIKTMTYKMRDVIRPWVDQLLADIAKGKLKSIKAYRVSLEALIDIQKDVKKVRFEAAAAEKEGKPFVHKKKTGQTKWSFFWQKVALKTSYAGRKVSSTLGHTFTWLNNISRPKQKEGWKGVWSYRLFGWLPNTFWVSLYRNAAWHHNCGRHYNGASQCPLCDELYYPESFSIRESWYKEFLPELFTKSEESKGKQPEGK